MAKARRRRGRVRGARLRAHELLQLMQGFSSVGLLFALARRPLRGSARRP